MSGCEEGVLIDFSDYVTVAEPDPIETNRRWVMDDVNMEASFIKAAAVADEKAQQKVADSVLDSSPIMLITDEDLQFDSLPIWSEACPKITGSHKMSKNSAPKEQKSDQNSNSSFEENWAEIQREANKLADIISQAYPEEGIMSKKESENFNAKDYLLKYEGKSKPHEKVFCQKKVLLGENFFAKGVLGEMESDLMAKENVFPKKKQLLGENLFAKTGLDVHLESTDELEDDKVDFNMKKLDDILHVSPVKKQKLECGAQYKLPSDDFPMGQRKSPRLNKLVLKSLENPKPEEPQGSRTVEDIPEKTERKPVARAQSMLSRIRPPVRLAKPSVPSIQPLNSNSTLNVSAATDRRSMSPASSVEDVSLRNVPTNVATNLPTNVPTRSRLSAPKGAALLPSKLKVPAASTNNEPNLSQAIEPKLSQAVEPKLSQAANQKVPQTKLQLLRPSRLQKPSMPVPSTDSEKKPMKAFAPQPQIEEETPVKADKLVKPKNLSGGLSTPSRAGGSRTSSTSSMRSLESPRPTKGSSSKPRDSANIEPTSPAALTTSKRPLVVNTPNMPKKRISPWSPIQKKPIDHVDLAFMCTKKVPK
ncbi:titin-like isoform X2 [Dreissena polymorpha]|uniref:titin-like isoform X2 n=1 Tax=Dreissena polymorpha TaxID=45954 RepID=UPI0022647E5E|nr:titin-like isoform X2 [Dreissena polymorpha]